MDRRLVKTTAILCSSMILLLGSLYLSTASRWVAAELERPVDFWLRSHISPTQKRLHKDLKVIVFDDRFIKQHSEFDLEKWSRFVTALNENRPKAILIDKFFSTPTDLENAAIFKQAMHQENVVSGAWAETYDLPRSPIPAQATFANRLDTRSLEDYAALSDGKVYKAYGLHKELEGSFKHLAHVMYDEDGMVRPFIPLSGGQSLVHLAFSHVGALSLRGRTLRVDDTKIPLDRDGKILADFPTVEAMYEDISTARIIWSKIQRNEPLDYIKPGDTVLIVPGFYTGSADIVSTPVGSIPGGLVHASVISSVLSNQWLRALPADTMLYFLSPLLFLLLGVLLPAKLALGAIGLFAALFFTGVATLFSSFGFYMSWFIPLTVGTSAGLGAVAIGAIRSEKRLKQMRDALKGMISDDQIKDLFEKNATLEQDPIGKVVTVMFVDVVGFAHLSEGRAPDEVFHTLKNMMKGISTIVHEHQGCVDRVMGDGLLCYFGHSHDSSAEPSNHAEQALRCAIAIQRWCITRIVEQDSGETKELKLPLRIGLNTCPAYFGDLSASWRIDPTLIGDGVNLAKRYESACSHFKICMGASTRNMLVSQDLYDYPIFPQLVVIKHHSKPVEAFEVDPAPDLKTERQQALRTYFDTLGRERAGERIPFHDDGSLKLSCGGRQVTIQNFSHEGWAIVMKDYWGVSAPLAFELVSSDPKIDDDILRHGLRNLIAEVRWAEPSRGKHYLHGMLIRNLSSDQMHRLQKIFASHNGKKSVLKIA